MFVLMHFGFILMGWLILLWFLQYDWQVGRIFVRSSHLLGAQKMAGAKFVAVVLLASHAATKKLSRERPANKFLRTHLTIRDSRIEIRDSRYAI